MLNTKFLEGTKFPCLIESAKFYKNNEGERKVRVNVALPVLSETATFLPDHIRETCNKMKLLDLKKVVFETEFEQRMVEIFDEEAEGARPKMSSEDMVVKKVWLERDEDAVFLHFSFVDDAAQNGVWLIKNFGNPAFVNVLAMQGELSGL